MRKSKTNISVADNTGARRTVDLILGDAAGYASGDILDANAVEKKINDVIGIAPEDLDTIAEAAEAIVGMLGEIDGIENSVNSVQEKVGNESVTPYKPTSPSQSVTDVLNKHSEDLETVMSVLPPSDILISTITIDESNSETGSKVVITGDVAANKVNGEIQYLPSGKVNAKSPQTNVISWIRENSDIVVAKYNKDRGCLDVMSLVDGTAQANISDIFEYIDNREQPDTDINVFMKLPTFWYRCKPNLDAGKWDISFANEDPENNEWIKWDGNTFIGCYKAGLAGDNVSTFKNGGTYNTDDTYITSHYGSKPSTWFSWRDGKKLAKNLGEGFSLVTYDAHKMMEILFYAYYGEVDSQLICGAGSAVESWDNNNHLNGRSMDDLVAFIDSKNSDNSTNDQFWGLCDWWGNVFEWVDNIRIMGPANPDNTDEEEITLAIYDQASKVERMVRHLNYYDDCQTKKLWGEHADVLSTECQGTEEDYPDTGYTVYGYVDYSLGSVAMRSGDSDYSDGGVGYLNVGNSPDDRNASCGSRLQYTGPYAYVYWDY